MKKNIEKKGSILSSEKQYGILHEKIVNHFGPYCGYAQQFLFKMERESHNKKWL